MSVSSALPPFTEPRFNLPVDVDAQIRQLPAKAGCKGLFFSDLVRRVRKEAPDADLHRLAGVAERRYVPVLEYPHADWMRLAAAAAGVLYSNVSLGEGLRRLGQHAYDSFFESPLGQVVFKVLGFDLEKILGQGGNAYFLSLSFGKVTASKVGHRRFQYRFENMPTFLETYNVGAIEGTIMHQGARPRVHIAMQNIGNATMDITWTD